MSGRSGLCSRKLWFLVEALAHRVGIYDVVQHVRLMPYQGLTEYSFKVKGLCNINLNLNPGLNPKPNVGNLPASLSQRVLRTGMWDTSLDHNSNSYCRNPTFYCIIGT